jgi:Ca-activated chloride channel family protein
VRVFSIESGYVKPEGPVEEEFSGRELFAELASDTGGRYYPHNVRPKLRRILTGISAQLRNEYVIGYRPPRGVAGVHRKVQVRVSRLPGQPRLSIAWRRGYYVPQ